MDIIILILVLYASVVSTYNFLKIKKGGKITNSGVISPNGKEIVKKIKR